MVKSHRDDNRRLGLGADMTRRDVVNGVLAGSGASLMMPGAAASAFGAAQANNDAFTGYGGVGDYADANGNTWSVMQAAHRIRDNKVGTLPRAEEAEAFDLVIVGGGPAGLLAAYEYTKRTGGEKRCLILENHPIFGGAARQNDFLVDGVRLTGPQASNSFVVPERGAGTQLDQLFDELELPRQYIFQGPPGAARGIRFATDNYANMDGFNEGNIDVGYYFASSGDESARLERNIWQDGLARTPFSEMAREDLLRWRKNDGGEEGLPPEALDRISYRHFLEEVKGYDAAVTRFAAPVTGLLTGLSPDAVSARVGMNYVNDKPTEYPTFPGGNSGMVLALIRKLCPGSFPPNADFADVLTDRINFAALDRAGQPARLRLGATAVSVTHADGDHDSDTVQVVYEKDGLLHAVTAGAVVMASGGWVNRRILKDMPEDMRTAYGEFIHAPAMIVNVALTNWRPLERLGVSALRWFDDDNMLGFSGNIRKPMVLGPQTTPLDPSKPAVLTMYMGLYTLGEKDARIQTMENRLRLFATSYAEYERRVKSQLAEILSPYGFDPATDIAGIVLNRWGHARVTQPPGFYYGPQGVPSPREVVEKGYGRVIMAHSELNGAQNLRGAFQHGARAAAAAVALT